MVKIRRAYEALFLGLFLFFLLITDLRYLKGWPVSLFLEATPLVAVSTALTTHTLYRHLVLHEDPAQDPEDMVVSHFSSTAPGAQQLLPVV